MNLHNNQYRPVLVLAPGVMAGAEKVVLTGLIGLKNAGLNPLMIIIKETRSPHFAINFKKALPENIESAYIESTKALDLKLPNKLKKILEMQSLPLVLHSHGFKALIACYLAKGKLPHTHTHHGNTGHTFKVRIYEKLAMLIMKNCDQLIAVSYQMKVDLEYKKASPKKLIVIENMLSLGNASKIRSQRLKRNSGIKIELIFIGRLSPEKGLISFLEFLNSSALKDKFHLNILGDGVEKIAIENFVKNQKMNSLVTLHGFVKDPSPYLITPDILIMPSLREGLPMTLIEALASGIPVMANNVGAISSMITSQHNGHLTKDFSKESWEDALESATKNYKNWLKNAEQEAILIEERFSVEKWVNKTCDLYTKLLNLN